MINFKSFAASDDFSDYIEKLNYNFSQINIYGGGPEGARGERGVRGVIGKGVKGDKGDRGVPGQDGENGSNVIQWNRKYLVTERIPFEAVFPEEDKTFSVKVEEDVNGELEVSVEGREDGLEFFLFIILFY